MTADSSHGPEWEQDAAELDDLAPVPTEVLSEFVVRYGACLWEITSGDPPAWAGKGPPDRDLALRLCAGCPVRRECLEFELRTAGPYTVGVWGGLNEDDRRALHAIWAARAGRPSTPDQHTEHEEEQQEGGER
jgi:WhiB family transcriptional regulator, redox-sensing transcriptional regulator